MFVCTTDSIYYSIDYYFFIVGVFSRSIAVLYICIALVISFSAKRSSQKRKLNVVRVCCRAFRSACRISSDTWRLDYMYVNVSYRYSRLLYVLFYVVCDVPYVQLSTAAIVKVCTNRAGVRFDSSTLYDFAVRKFWMVNLKERRDDYQYVITGLHGGQPACLSTFEESFCVAIFISRHIVVACRRVMVRPSNWRMRTRTNEIVFVLK